MANSYPIKIWSGLLADGHTAKIENALWEFVWLVNKVTKETDGVGYVLGGAPIKVDDICIDLKRTYQSVYRHLQKLKKTGYINMIKAPYGLIISINNSKKFVHKSLIKNDKAGLIKNDKSLIKNDKSLIKNDKSLIKNDKANKILKILKDTKDTKDIKEIYILEYWNNKEIVIHQQTNFILKQIKIALKKYKKENILLAIDNYAKVFKDTSFYYGAKWRLDNFLKQSNGVPAFLSDGKIWINYDKIKVEDSRGVGYELYD